LLAYEFCSYMLLFHICYVTLLLLLLLLLLILLNSPCRRVCTE
jgi:uncharacterized integral membrane protein